MMLRRGHLLVRIFFTFLLATVVIVGGVFGFVSWFFDEAPVEGVAGRNLAAYADHLVARVGTPPDPLRAQAVARELELVVKVEDLAGHPVLESRDRHMRPLPPYAVLEPHVRRITGDARGGRWRGHWFVAIERGGYRYLFATRGQLHPWRYMPLIGMAAFITVILALSFLTIRWTLEPLNALMFAVEKIAGGELGYRVELKRQGEFRVIADAFNALAARIEAMIRGKERLLLDVSHELRSPLTRMKVASAMVTDPLLREGLEGDIREMEVMVAEILESYRLKSPHGALKKNRADLGSILGEAVASATPAEVGSRVQLEMQGDLMAVVDPVRLAMVFTNLIENALKHSRETSAPVLARLWRVGDALACEIRDSGRGIAPEDLAHVFEPFYRVDRSRDRNTGGFGLGLSICRDIIEAHGGTIAIESELGRGTTVRFKIPVA